MKFAVRLELNPYFGVRGDVYCAGVSAHLRRAAFQGSSSLRAVDLVEEALDAAAGGPTVIVHSDTVDAGDTQSIAVLVPIENAQTPVQVALSITNQNGDVVATKSATADAFGTVLVNMDIPKGSAPGIYTVATSAMVNGSAQAAATQEFRVTVQSMEIAAILRAYEHADHAVSLLLQQ